MNIVVASSNSPYEELAYTRLSAGGAERGLRIWAEHAVATHHVTYLSTAHKGFHPISRLLRDEVNGVSVVHLQGPSMPSIQRVVANARRRSWYRAVSDVCREVSADVILTYATIPDTHAAVIAKRDQPDLHVVEWMAGRSWHLHLERLPQDIDRVAEAFAGKDLTLFESAALEVYTREQLSARSLPALGETALVKFPSPVRPNVSFLSMTAAGEPGQIVVSCIATFKPGSKRQDILIRAWPDVLSHIGDAKLVFTGDGPLRSACESLTVELGVAEHVQFLGMVTRERLDGLIASSTLTVLPTEFEGRPQAILESLMAGVPVVASDIPAVREVLEPLGEVSARMLAPNTPEGFASAIVAMLEDPSVCDKVRRSVREHFEHIGSADDEEFFELDSAVMSAALEGRV